MERIPNETRKTILTFPSNGSLRKTLSIKSKKIRGSVDAALIALAVLVVLVQSSTYAFNPESAISPNANVNTGWYDNMQIYYSKATLQTNAEESANLIKAGSVVYHVQNLDGSVPTSQTTFPVPPTGGVATAGNVISQIPTDIGYSGGNWNLQFFTWNTGGTHPALTSDTDILAAVAAGEGTLTVTNVVVRCPVIDFSTLR